jgi:NAD(P)-dependent dehydrogenase (short-subunit alcohol dehydrogenase family)
VVEKICVVTGGNSGVGFETSRLLAESGARVVLVCRDQERGQMAMTRIKGDVPSARVSLEVADLASLAQVRDLSARLLQALPSLDLLVNNAGVVRAEHEKTEDGFEKTMAVNHLSHFLLTHLLLSKMIDSGGRVINVSSEAHRRSRLSPDTLEDALLGPARYNGMQAYSHSKLANILFTSELARRHTAGELSTCSVHPGVLATRIWNQNRNLLSFLMVLLKPTMGRPSTGGKSVAHLAGQPAEFVHGRYFNKKREAWPAPPARDKALARSLWKLSTDLTGLSTQAVPSAE